MSASIYRHQEHQCPGHTAILITCPSLIILVSPTSTSTLHYCGETKLVIEFHQQATQSVPSSSHIHPFMAFCVELKKKADWKSHLAPENDKTRCQNATQDILERIKFSATSVPGLHACRKSNNSSKLRTTGLSFSVQCSSRVEIVFVSKTKSKQQKIAPFIWNHPLSPAMEAESEVAL